MLRRKIKMHLNLFTFTLFSVIIKVHSQVHYFVWDSDVEDAIEMSEFEDLPGSGLWNLGSDLKILIHGWSPLVSDAVGNLHIQGIYHLARNFGRYDPSLNIILVDWARVHGNNNFIEYNVAAANTQRVGEEIARFLQDLKSAGAFGDWSKVHILGFSLGAHVSGVAGYETQQMGDKIGRITGLDPAGPRFIAAHGKWPNPKKILDYTDADFVDIIHSNMGGGNPLIDVALKARLGSNLQTGHVDIYPNGGTQQKYQCNFISDRTEACSHLMSVLFYASSLADPTAYIACPCKSYRSYRLGHCSCSYPGTGIPLGELAKYSLDEGRYYLTIKTPKSEISQ